MAGGGEGGGGGGGLGSGWPRGESSTSSTFSEQFIAEHHNYFEYRHRRKSGQKIVEKHLTNK